MYQSILFPGVSKIYYTVYKITNLLNQKFYIGKHQTKNVDDQYFGSGKLLNRAIRKYGVHNFKKEILEVYDAEWKMNLAEKILVVTDKEVSYNLCSGGKGGFGFINKNNLNFDLKSLAPERLREIQKKGAKLGAQKTVELKCGIHDPKYISKKKEWGRKGQKLSMATKGKNFKKTPGSAVGNKNSQFGTIWITNGDLNVKIKKYNPIPHGFYRGRLCGNSL